MQAYSGEEVGTDLNQPHNCSVITVMRPKRQMPSSLRPCARRSGRHLEVIKEERVFQADALFQSETELIISPRYACTFAESILKITVIIRIHDSVKYIGEKSYHERCCGSRTSQIQVHCKRSLTYTFGYGLVPIMGANYYKGWSEMRKVKLNLAISIHCPI